MKMSNSIFFLLLLVIFSTGCKKQPEVPEPKTGKYGIASEVEGNYSGYFILFSTNCAPGTQDTSTSWFKCVDTFNIDNVSITYRDYNKVSFQQSIGTFSFVKDSVFYEFRNEENDFIYYYPENDSVYVEDWTYTPVSGDYGGEPSDLRQFYLKRKN